MFARTDRLLLRPGWREDAPQLQRAINEEAVVRNLARVPWPYGLEDAEAFLAAQPEAGLPRLLAFQRTAGAPRLIGGVWLSSYTGGEVELGYWIARPFWGLGFATEAGRALVAMARRSLRLPRLIAGHAIDNPASAHVLRKLGFRATGRIISRHSAGRGSAMECAEMTIDLNDGPTAPVA